MFSLKNAKRIAIALIVAIWGVLIALFVLTSCGVLDDAKDEVVPDPIGDIFEIAEQQCALHPEYPCGHVWMCDTPAQNELGMVEVCVWNQTPITDVEAVYGSCILSPSERFHGHQLCWWGCVKGWVGCNSFSGCFCNGYTPPPAPVDGGVP